jgi:hypothetical protein
MKDRAEVCPLSRGVMLPRLSIPLQDGVRFFRIPLPAASLVRLATSYRYAEDIRLTVFRVSNRMG